MKLLANVLVIVLFGGAVPVWGQVEAGTSRPRDMWNVDIWGGLPPFADDTESPDESAFRNQKSVLDIGVHLGSSAAPRLPSPCTDANFLPPIYDLHEWNMTKTYLNASGEYPLRYHFSVTVQDVANNYSVRCSGDFPVPWSPNTDWRVLCIPETAFPDDQYGGNIWLVLFPLQRGEHGLRPNPREIWISGTPIGVDHLWFCPPRSNDSLYPRVYRANGGLRDNEVRGTPTRFNGSCPPQGTTNTPYVCNITTSPAVNSTLTRPLFSGKTNPLLPHPVSAPIEDRPQLVPTQDCTTMSLSYPNWVVESTTYVPSQPKASVNTTIFNVTITSRATGATNFCSWAGSNQWLTCSPPPGATQDPSQTLFQAHFNFDSRELSIRQNWTCGDAEGSYSRAYRASKTYVMPLFCTEDQVCKANRHTVKGELQTPLRLTPVAATPPPGANLAGCTANSATPRWMVSTFRFEETRKTTRLGSAARTPPTPGSWGSPTRMVNLSLTNLANNYTQSCTSYTYGDTRPVTPWIRCFPENVVAQRYIETYIQFNTTSGVLHLNQTWYCSDTDPSRPLLYHGIANIKSTHCGETNIATNNICYDATGCIEYVNTRWCDTARHIAGSNGLLEPQNRTFAGELLRTEILPANALTDPDPDPKDWSCLADSIGRPVTWTLRPAPAYDAQPGAFFTTVPRFRYLSAFSVYLDNSALSKRPGGHPEGFELGASTEKLTPHVTDFEPTYWYTLGSIFADLRPRPFRNVVDWGFRFDATVGYLEVNHTWFCEEKSPGKPILFNGTWAGYVDMNCKWNVTESAVGCYFGSDGLVVKPRVRWTMLESMNGIPRYFGP
ncbi:hypothetical protein B0T16DRAFT_455514 [Cercophora newfieldiana]|uniref:Uncharacterized protein n=1 Tax=Cercophora newfieldiana TaxID=92897 RepID=A0AA40CSQ3_9PEZI|nr:hypothetical protein B0T16DRAFT_455514 [Cercophora newfieldiana]